MLTVTCKMLINYLEDTTKLNTFILLKAFFQCLNIFVLKYRIWLQAPKDMKNLTNSFPLRGNVKFSESLLNISMLAPLYSS